MRRLLYHELFYFLKYLQKMLGALLEATFLQIKKLLHDYQLDQ